MISTLVVYLLGDLLAQSLRPKEKEEGAEEEEGRILGGYEPERTAKALVIGAGSAIPTYMWFIHLGNSFNYPSRMLSLLTKVVVNQIVYTPIFNSYFFGMQALLSFHHSPLTLAGWAGIVDHVARTVPTSFVNSCKLWPAVTAVNFLWVPVEFRPVFAGVVAVGWQGYLSFLNRRAEGEEEDDEMVEVMEGKATGKVATAEAKSVRETGTMAAREKQV